MTLFMLIYLYEPNLLMLLNVVDLRISHFSCRKTDFLGQTNFLLEPLTLSSKACAQVGTLIAKCCRNKVNSTFFIPPPKPDFLKLDYICIFLNDILSVNRDSSHLLYLYSILYCPELHSTCLLSVDLN